VNHTSTLMKAIVAIGKARAACAQSFALWQQATIEFTCHDHSIIACSCHICGVFLHAHPVHGESHISTQRHQRLQHYHEFTQENNTFIRSPSFLSSLTFFCLTSIKRLLKALLEESDFSPLEISSNALWKSFIAKYAEALR